MPPRCSRRLLDARACGTGSGDPLRRARRRRVRDKLDGGARDGPRAPRGGPPGGRRDVRVLRGGRLRGGSASLPGRDSVAPHSSARSPRPPPPWQPRANTGSPPQSRAVAAAEALAKREGEKGREASRALRAAARDARVAAAAVESFDAKDMPWAFALHAVVSRPIDPIAAADVFPRCRPQRRRNSRRRVGVAPGVRLSAASCTSPAIPRREACCRSRRSWGGRAR